MSECTGKAVGAWTLAGICVVLALGGAVSRSVPSFRSGGIRRPCREWAKRATIGADVLSAFNGGARDPVRAG